MFKKGQHGTRNWTCFLQCSFMMRWDDVNIHRNNPLNVIWVTVIMTTLVPNPANVNVFRKLYLRNQRNIFICCYSDTNDPTFKSRTWHGFDTISMWFLAAEIWTLDDLPIVSRLSWHFTKLSLLLRLALDWDHKMNGITSAVILAIELSSSFAYKKIKSQWIQFLYLRISFLSYRKISFISVVGLLVCLFPNL